MTDNAMKQDRPNSQTVDRGEAVNLARSLVGSCELTSTLTDHGVRTLANAVLLMDSMLRAQQDGPSSRDAVLEEAAEVCDRAASKWHSDYKIGNGPHRASSHREGMSDGADELATAIRALKTSAPSEAGADDARDAAIKDLRVALPYLRYAVQEANKNGSAKLGVLCEQADGGGKVECKFDASILDAVALVIDLPAQTEKDDLKAKARAFLDQHGLTQSAATDRREG